MGLLLVVLFIVVPIIEIYVIVQVGQQIGVIPTVILLLAESVLGAWLVKREGARTWRALRGAFGTGRFPSIELADGALVLIGGTLLLTPGFVTDVVGFFLVVPLTRPVARKLLGWILARRTGKALGSRFGVRPDVRRPRRVVQGEVIEDDDRQS